MSRVLQAAADSPRQEPQAGRYGLEFPPSLRQQLRRFRLRVWGTKLAEALLLAVLVGLLGLLLVYAVDRVVDTPRSVRLVGLAIVLMFGLLIPRALYRWVWEQRRPDQLARLLRRRDPVVGDQLLSAIELAQDRSEQARSHSLCAAAIRQVAEVAGERDLRRSAPRTLLKPLVGLLLIAGAVLAGLAVATPAALSNAWSRFLLPLRDVERFTFCRIEPVPSRLVIAHGEEGELVVRLAADSHSRPQAASLNLAGRPPLQATLVGSDYRLQLPPQTSPVPAVLRVGDYYRTIQIEPMTRPQLVVATATICLPEYLGRQQPMIEDVRSGRLMAVEGSRLEADFQASRSLAAAYVGGQPVEVDGTRFSAAPLALEDAPGGWELNWRDIDGLEPLEPFRLTIEPFSDEPPSIVVRDLPRQAVVLDSEQLNFEILTSDDFGVRRVGLTWSGIPEATGRPAAEGEKVLAAGDATATALQTPAVFCAADLGISAQPIEVRMWVEDFLPERDRVYSPPHRLYVLTTDQHAVWIMDQLSRWHRSAIEVRDRELQLYEENQRLRQQVAAGQTVDADMRQNLQRQAALEKANARRLDELSRAGERLLRTAARNPEIGVGHLERWAEMLLVLGDISQRRMPSVAELLQATADQPPRDSAEAMANPRPLAGQIRRSDSAGQPSPDRSPEAETATQSPQSQAPALVDSESTLAGPVDSPTAAPDGQTKPSASGGRLTLPQTTIARADPPADQPADSPSTEDSASSSIDQAVQEQAELLAEFQKLTDDLNEVLANLEGSTLVKRLKAASREQMEIAGSVTRHLPDLFGAKNQANASMQGSLDEIASTELAGRQRVSYIMDDLQSYLERRQMNRFQLVLDEMREAAILDALQTLAESIPVRQGLSVAQAEYWADTLDRWADDLVDPTGSGQCPGCKSSDSLPPSVVLEALRILEAEVNLREATRVTEQARPAGDVEAHAAEAGHLAETQSELAERTTSLVQAIEDLPEGASRFGREVQLLQSVSVVMREAVGILEGGDTGPRAIAAETEAIELLLQSRSVNPQNRGGGGGGTEPGGGGTGSTEESALALVGTGVNLKEQRQSRETMQATGVTGRWLPEEYRGGLDQYFSQLEQAP